MPEEVLGHRRQSTRRGAHRVARDPASFLQNSAEYAAGFASSGSASGETVAGRLRFAPAAPVRLALWRKPLET